MRVNKILNNNLVLSKNEDNEEIIIKGLGIGYHAKRGDKIDESLIEKIFYPKNHQNSIQMQQIFFLFLKNILTLSRSLWITLRKKRQIFA